MADPVPTGPEIADHLERGGHVDHWSPERQAWDFIRLPWSPSWWRIRTAPQPGFRLAPVEGSE